MSSAKPIQCLLPALLGLGMAGAMTAIALVSPGPAQANDLSFEGQVRVRGEVDQRSFSDDAATKQYTDLRTRIGARATISDNTKAFVQIQDSRRFGGNSPSGAQTSGTLAYGANLDVHQAYITIARLAGPVGLQAGRFEVNLGNQRVFGAVGWHNVGRSWEGAKARLDLEKVTVDGYWLKRIERDDPDGNRDFDIFGVNATLQEAGVEFFAFYENDAKLSSGSTPGSLERIDLGAYANRKYGRLDVTSNLVMQLGNQEYGSTARGDVPVDERDISAFLATLELGFKIGESGNSRVAAGIDFASGDDDPADDKINSYDNLYYTGHKFRGAMDYFLGSASEGLLDIVFRGSTELAEGWKGKADLHWFSSAVEYVDFEGAKTSSIGIEIDAAASTTRVAGVAIDLGASAFLPSDSFAGSADTNPGLWFYTTVTSNF